MCRRWPGPPPGATKEDTHSGPSSETLRHSYLQFLTFRLCKLGSEGRPGITEECFANNVLEFATNFTMIAGANGRENGTFEKFEQTDLREGTHPVGSVWRPIGKIMRGTWYILR